LTQWIEEEIKKRVAAAAAASSNLLSKTLDSVVGNTSNMDCCITMPADVNQPPSEQPPGAGVVMN
jgi:hypothetical protein